MKKLSMLKGAIFGLAIGAGIGALSATKNRTVRSKTAKAARALSDVADSIKGAFSM